MSFTRANGLPKFNSSLTLSKRDLDVAKVNNQFVLNGNAPVFPSPLTTANSRIIVFLEYYFATAIGNILDGNGVAIISSIPANTHFNFGTCPIRLDGGVRFSANGVISKGFFIETGISMSQGV